MIRTKNHISKAGIWKAPIQRKNKICLDLNENTHIDQSFFQKLINNISPDYLYTYPEYDSLLNKLAKYCGVERNNLLITNGADQAIDIILRTFCLDKKVVLPIPTFTYYQQICNIENIKMVKIPYKSDFAFPIEEVLDSINEETDGVLLCNPSNPLSIEISFRDIDLILDKARDNNCFVLIDEAYFEFYKRTYANKIADFQNLLIIRSFSKGFGLAGLRVGYIISCKKNITQMKKVRGPWDINSIAIKIAEACLDEDRYFEYLKDLVDIKKEIVDFLIEKRCTVLDSKTNFITFKCPNSEIIANNLAKSGVLVTALSNYLDSGSLLNNHIRMSIPNKCEKNIVLKLLEEYL